MEKVKYLFQLFKGKSNGVLLLLVISEVQLLNHQ
jgi:hypothetical protein